MNQLPTEILEIIFAYLKPSDLKNAILVCKRWFEVAGSSSLWTWVSLIVTNDKLPHIPHLMTEKRMQNIALLFMKNLDHALIHSIARHL